MNNFPKGINKIIEDYCCYEAPFIKELHKTTFFIFDDTNVVWSYDKYYIDMDSNIKYFADNYRIIRGKYGWKVGFKLS